MTASPSPPQSDQVEAAQVLEPCPFCDGPAWLRTERKPPKLSVPQCRSCGADLGGFPKAAEAIAAWNRRPVAALRPVTQEALIAEARLSVAELGAVDKQLAAEGVGFIGPGSSRRVACRDAASTMEKLITALRPVTSVAPEGMREATLSAIAAVIESDPRYDPGSVGGGRFVNAAVLATRILAALPPASGSDHGPVGWRAITEHDGSDTPVIVAAGDAVGEAYLDETHGWHWAGNHWTDATDGAVYGATHWQPLPAPPLPQGGV